ncbi:fasciclin domain-containing protein [Pedobacter frigiditerrae]|uniref:Fasciclin domain-containing protein n=1 Tax=Pedobacter frigiditerrae TaxID=2530452 RepID=A0A4R0MTT2_9SPHI|nr:fasciclin domain-containing protein [Pedobacter frigiditerrae]TCC90460.1 fasciclin domain-containing protein [Pedobacter frigiditerrae]
MKKFFLCLALGVVSSAFISSCSLSKADSASENLVIDSNKAVSDVVVAETNVEVGGAIMVASKNIFDNITNSKDHTTLIAAVKQAGLVEILSSDDSFTVFAPTNQAFSTIPKATLDSLMKPEAKADLTKVLTYHIVLGALRVSDLKDGEEITTVQGGKLKVGVKNGKVMINNASITISDIVSNNGITHVIDGVLMPR